MDFSNLLFRCSSLQHLMPGLTNYELDYKAASEKKDSLYDSFMKCQQDYDEIKNKETETAKKKKKTLDNWSEKFADAMEKYEALKPIKDSVKLSDGAETHLIDLYVAHTKNRSTKDVKSKYIEKGVMLEEKGITLVSKITGLFHEKSLERRDDGYITGETDFIQEDSVDDIKISWDIWTFSRNIKFLKKERIRTNPYYWNMQGYMKLWEKEKANLWYCLLDTPKVLLDRELRKLAYDLPETMYEEAAAELERNLTYSDIDINEKVIKIPIERDEQDIALIPKAITEARNYLNNIKTINYVL